MGAGMKSDRVSYRWDGARQIVNGGGDAGWMAGAAQTLTALRDSSSLALNLSRVGVLSPQAASE